MKLTAVLSFLNQLRANNNKAWMDAHRDEYQAARQSVIDLTAYLLNGLAPEDEGLAGLDPKKCIFRINRDVRFSKDKSPYKLNFGTAMAEGGRHSGNPVYYLQIQPLGESFIAGGLYQAPTDVLARVRQEIDYNAAELKPITDDDTFRRYFGAIQGDSLKRAPKGYSPDHPNIELIKLKDYLVMHKLTDEQVTDEQFPEQALSIFRAMVPFVRYLSVAIS